MRNFNQSKKWELPLRNLALFLAISLALIGQTHAQLSGSYTIDPTKPASNTNYTAWASAVSDLLSGTRSDGGVAQGSGVNGAVTITVYDSVYTGKISLGAITGTSSTNRITFKSAGGDSTKCVVRAASSSSAGADYVLQFNGADFVTFQGIGFERTGNSLYSTVVNFTNNSDNCTLSHCWLKGRKRNSNSSNGFQYGIGSVIYYTGNADNTTINDCKLIYGYNGIYGTSSCSGNTYENNVIDTSGSSGIYHTSQTGLKIIGNTFNMGDFGPNKGHYTSYGMRIETSPAVQILKNKIFMLARNGQVVRAVILATITSTSSAPTLVANNWILNAGGTGDCTGLAVYSCNYVDFYFNNVLITNSLKAGAAYYHYANFTNSNINLVNNNFVNKGGGFAYNVPGTNTGDLVKVNFNNLYSNGTYLAKWGGTDYSTFAAFKTGASKDSASINSDPGFVSSTDLHVSNIGINGKGTPYAAVKDDIDGETRSTTAPDIGADEFFPAQHDAGVSNLDEPQAFCAGKSDVKVSIANYGQDTLKSVSISWSVNGTSQKSTNWTGKVAPGSSSASITLGSFSFSANTPYSFKIWTSKPNNQTDGKTVNDTLSITRLTGLSGTYSIGASGSTDYKSFNDAITDMTARGICGATTFNVADGIYNEQITLTQLGGMGTNNPVVFQGVSKDSSKVVITLPSTTATGNNNAAVQLRGADNVAFKYMTFERTGTNAFATVVHILDGAHNNTFENCRMLGVLASNLTSVNIWSDQGKDTGNVFRNNYVKWGMYSMQYGSFSSQHENGTIIEGNVFDSATSSSVLINYNDGVEIRNNVFGPVRNPPGTNFDLILGDCDSALTIMNNQFFGNTETSLRLDNCQASGKNRGFIANNVFAKANGLGIYLDGVQYQNIVFNSLNFTGLDTNSALVSTGQSRNNVLKNNSFVLKSGRILELGAKIHFSESDFNNFKSFGNGFALIGGTNYGALGALRNNTNRDSSSVSTDPLYKSATDLLPSNPGLHSIAQPYTEVPTDIAGKPRGSTPDIGAFEFDLAANDAGIIKLVGINSQQCAGTFPVDVVLQNFGSADLTSVDIIWTIGGVAQTTYKWTGTLASKAIDTVTLGNFAFAGNSQPKIVVSTFMPNGNVDAFKGNDGITASRLFIAVPPINAGNNVAVCAGDSVEIGPKNNSIYDYEWSTLGGTVVGTTSKIYVNPSSTADYVLKITDGAFGCFNRDTLSVSVNPNPIADAGIDQLICLGASTAIGSAVKTNHSYSWTSMPSSVLTSAAQPNVSPSVNTTYYLEETIDSSGCKDMDTVEISISVPTKPDIVGDTVLCAESTIGYSTASTIGHTYQWRSTGSFQGGATSNSTMVTWNNAGAQNLKVIETNGDGCSDSVSVSVTVNAKPVADMELESNCVGRPYGFRNVSANTKTTQWNFGNGNSSNSPYAIHTYTTAGKYDVKLVVDNNDGCTDTLVQAIELFDAPKATFTVGKLCEGDSVAFTNTSKNGNGYRWDFANGQTSTLENPKAFFNDLKFYNVKLVAEGDGCNDSTVTSIRLNEKPSASFTGTVTRDSVQFKADEPGHTYAWTFSDGQTSTDKDPLHEFYAFREYVKASLTVTSSAGCESSSTDSFYIDISGIDGPTPIGSASIFPNPFASHATLKMDLVESVRVKISLYDLHGKEVLVLAEGQYLKGTTIIQMDGSNLNGGVYLLKMDVNGYSNTERIIRQ